MKFLIISDAWHPQVNGVVRTYEHLSQKLEENGHSVKVIGPSDCPWTIPMPGYSEIRLAFNPNKIVKKTINSFKPNGIHLAAEGPLGWTARNYCIKNKIPFTTSYHTHFPDYFAKRVSAFIPLSYNLSHKLGIQYVKKFHKASSTVMVATHSLEQQLLDWGFNTPMSRLTKGIDTTLFFPSPEKKLFKNLKRPIALYVGRVAVEKNIEAFLSAKWEGSKVVVGNGPILSLLKTKYPKVLFVGQKVGDELAEHYRSADIFVFPSKTDTFGIVIIEALACGLPVAAYNESGPKDIIKNAYLGYLDENNIEFAMLKALKTPKTAKDRYDYVLKNYSWEKAAQQFEETVKEKAYIQ